MRKLILILPVALTGCGSNAPDFGPIGAGLAVIGLGIVIAALIIAIFRKGGGGDD
ncbi:MAG: hypothetical protein WCQ16_04985 [Verrucomicrobiae bacterium]